MTSLGGLSGIARAHAESLMTSTCTIRARATETTTDVDGETVDVPGAIVYAGKCGIRPANAASSSLTFGGGEVFTFDYLVSIPFAEAAVTEGHRVRVDSSPDPALTAAEWEIRKVARGDRITARRLACAEVS